MREKFYFFGSFRETAKAIEDSRARLEYLEAVIRHGLGDEEIELSPLINCLMVQTRFTLDRSKEIASERSEAWKKWSEAKSKAKLWNQNAKKNWEIIAKQNKTQQIKTKQNEVEEEVEYIKENILKEKKDKYLDFVKLTPSEFSKLKQNYWIKATNEFIARLNNYIGSKWDHYKSHYYTILSRMKKDWVIAIQPQPTLPQETEPQWLLDTIKLRR